MKLLIPIVLLTTTLMLSAAEKSAADPFADAFFPPEAVLLARDKIGLTQPQQEAFRACVEKAQPRSEELRQQLERATAALSALAQPGRVDEAALAKQLDKVLDAERQLKHLHVGLLVAIKNLLTPEQQVKLRGLTQDRAKQLAEETHKRLSEKVELVKAGAHRWAAGGRDPSAVLKAMEEKFKPLIETGKVIEAEAELDRVLEQLKPDAK